MTTQWTGEQGPELVRFLGGEHVLPSPALEPAAELDGDWICPSCLRGRCDRCTARECACCSGSPDEPA